MGSPLRASIAAGLFGLVGCSLWVSAEPGEIGCTAEGKLGPPACDTGFICAWGACVRCAAAEVCGDGVDNDCNGRVDDRCSNVSGSGGSAAHSAAFGGAAGVAKSAGGADSN
jgi:Putative metal-binding motif